MIYRHSPEMGEISGFGGSYEDCCQDMLEAGVNWLIAHPNAHLLFSSFKGVFGLLRPESDDAREIEKIVSAAAQGEETGAMHHAVMLRLGFIAKNGWDRYCEELRNRKKD